MCIVNDKPAELNDTPAELMGIKCFFHLLFVRILSYNKV